MAPTRAQCSANPPGRKRRGQTINLKDIRYVRVGTRDLASTAEFANEMIGIEVVQREGDCVYLSSEGNLDPVGGFRMWASRPDIPESNHSPTARYAQ